MADGFKLAQNQAVSGLGPFIQMKNAVGDLAEQIGFVFLEDLQKAALAIKDWVQKNQGATSTENNGPNPPSEKQLEYLISLGYTGQKPKTMYEAGKIIEDLKIGAKTQ